MTHDHAADHIITARKYNELADVCTSMGDARKAYEYRRLAAQYQREAASLLVKE